MQILGIVRLAPGQVGYFDDLTRIHLTLANPEKPVIAGMNTTNLRRAVGNGSLKLVSGSLTVEPAAQAPAVAQATTPPPAEPAFTPEAGTVDINVDAKLAEITTDEVQEPADQEADPATQEEVATEAPEVTEAEAVEGTTVQPEEPADETTEAAEADVVEANEPVAEEDAPVAETEAPAETAEVVDVATDTTVKKTSRKK